MESIIEGWILPPFKGLSLDLGRVLPSARDGAGSLLTRQMDSLTEKPFDCEVQPAVIMP